MEGHSPKTQTLRGNHEREGTDIPALIRKLEAQEEEQRRKEGNCIGSGEPVAGLVPLKDVARQGSRTMSLCRVTERRDKSDNISSQLAADDLTGMELEAGNVIEARGKEIQYVRDMRVHNKIPRAQANRNGWKIIKTRWIDINTGDDENPQNTESDW